MTVTLATPLPSSLPVGSGTALFVYGTCSHPGQPVRKLEILVDGARHRPAASGMRVGGEQTGFWATITIGPRERPGAIELGAAAMLARGAEQVTPLGRIEVRERERTPAPPPGAGRDLIAVCMATFEPRMELFRRQIDSLRAQTDRDWICLISDDCSAPERFAEIGQTVAGDERFVLSRSERRLGFYRNFERALRMAPAEARLMALCDQDDRWFPEKLEVLRGALGGAQLAYSDQRLVDAEGRVLRDTLWQGRRNDHTSLISLLVANSITGAATLFRREVAELALPFPDPPGWQFHDHWIGLVALASGDLAYVDRPLYDYVQHPGAVFGDVSSGESPAAAGLRPRVLLAARRGAMERWRAAYFYGYLGRELQARVLLARCSSRLSPRKRRALRRFVASARSPLAFAWLAVRPLRALAGLNETLGSEAQLARGILWRVLAGMAGRAPLRLRRWAPEAGLPGLASFSQTRLRRWRARV